MKKQSLLFLFACLLSFTLHASATNDAAVELVKYDQSWLDHEATICLRNQLQVPIHGVKFQLIYYDMNDQQIDYKDFHVKGKIDPGMAKIFKISSFQHDQFYHYYKTSGNYSYPEFKITFKLLQAITSSSKKVASTKVPSKKSSVQTNLVDKVQATEAVTLSGDKNKLAVKIDEVTEGENDWLYSMITFFTLGAAICLCILPFVIVHRMARSRGRDALPYVLLSFFISPFIIMLILLIIGNDRYSNRI